MAHDVFISYAVEDKEVAGRVCEALEAQAIKCWMAPRDIPYGADYEEAIVDAIASSPLLVLILSAHSNASPHVKREIQNACAEGSPTEIIPLRIEAVPYSKALRYYLGSAQWLDASTPPLESHLERLVEHVRTRLRRTTGALTPPAPAPPQTEPAAEPKSVLSGTGTGRKPFPVAWLAAGALLLAGVAAFVIWPGSTGDPNGGAVAGMNSPHDTNENVVAPTPTPGLNPPTPTPKQSPAPTPTPPASPTPTPTPTPAPVSRDEYIADALGKRMANYKGLKDVTFDVRRGVVTLKGKVWSQTCYEVVEKISRVRGVVRVENETMIMVSRDEREQCLEPE